MSNNKLRGILMDDNMQILNLTKSLLEIEHIDMLTSETGEEAIELYKKNIDSIDFVLLDLGNDKGMGGIETLQHLKQINPNIVSIAYSGSIIDYDFKKDGFSGALQKPINIKIMKNYICDLIYSSNK